MKNPNKKVLLQTIISTTELIQHEKSGRVFQRFETHNNMYMLGIIKF